MWTVPRQEHSFWLTNGCSWEWFWDRKCLDPGSTWIPKLRIHGTLARYIKLRVAHAPGMLGTFPPPQRVSDPDMHHGTCVAHVPWYMSGSLTSGFLWSRWRGKRSQHSQRMRNPWFYVCGKRPMPNDLPFELPAPDIYTPIFWNTDSCGIDSLGLWK